MSIQRGLPVIYTMVHTALHFSAFFGFLGCCYRTTNAKEYTFVQGSLNSLVMVWPKLALCCLALGPCGFKYSYVGVFKNGGEFPFWCPYRRNRFLLGPY